MKSPSDQLLEQIATRLRAMGNRNRLTILNALAAQELPVNEILSRVGGSQANVSKHLNVLRAADLVTRRRDGVNIYYGLADASVLEICRTVCDSLLDTASLNIEALKLGRNSILTQ